MSHSVCVVNYEKTGHYRNLESNKFPVTSYMLDQTENGLIGKYCTKN